MPFGSSTERRFTFDAVAELYDRRRPGYPPALFDDLVELTRLPPGGRMLEIGCGTGQATSPMARRGFEIVCLEPGQSLAALARANVKDCPGVRVLCETFEDWQPEPAAFDLVMSAQAFHWISPELRFARAAEVLKPGGSLAVIGNAATQRASPVRSALDAAYRRHAPELSGPPPTRWYSDESAVAQLFDDSGYFASAQVRRYPWTRQLNTTDYVELMQTHSDHNLLPESQRSALLSAIGRAVEENGGFVEEEYVANLYVARLP